MIPNIDQIIDVIHKEDINHIIDVINSLGQDHETDINDINKILSELQDLINKLPQELKDELNTVIINKTQVMSGATTDKDGEEGIVPAPVKGASNRFLSSDATWKVIEFDTEPFVMKSDLLNLVYPVGAIYISVSATDPGTLFGGTWQKISAGKFLLSEGTDSDKTVYMSETTGGNKQHTITAQEMPRHTHSVTISSAGNHTHSRGTMNITGSITGGAVEEGFAGTGAFKITTLTKGANGSDDYDYGFDFDASRSWTGATSSNGNHTHTVTIKETGSGQAYNTMPPYYVCYMWKRIA